MEVTESTTRVYAQPPPGLSTAGSTTYPQQQTGSTYPSSTHVGTGTTYPSTSNVGSSYPSTSNVGSSYTHSSSSHLGTGATTGTGLGTSMGHPVASSSSSAYGAGSGYEKSAGYGSGAAGYGSEKMDTTHPQPVSSNPFDKNVSYASGSGAYNPSHPVGGVVPGQHAVPIGYDNNLVSGIALRPGLAFPLGDVPYSSRTGSIFDVVLAALGILGLLAISAISDWAIDHQGRKGWYFGSACMAFFGLFFWFAVTWWGWRYARESVSLSQGARAFWVGLLIGGAVSAVMWGATIHPLRYQFERWRLDGSRFDQKKTTHLMLVNALALPLMDQALILVALFWMTTRKRFRLWRPYSYLVVAVGLEIGSWFAQQIIVYSVFPAWHTAAGAYAGNEYFARGLYGEALFFLLCAVLYFVCAGLLAGGARAIHQLPDRDQVEMAHVGDMPPELFPGPLAASVLLMMMLVLRAIPELFRLAVLTQGGQSFAATKTSIVLVYLLVGILGLVLLRHRIRSTLPVVLALDPTGYTVAHRPKHVGMAPMFHHHAHHSSALASNPNAGVVTRV